MLHPSAETHYWLQATGTPGLEVALLAGGKTRQVLCFGSTDLEGKVPITEAAVFQVASLSKQALLYAVLKTVEAGKLDLERPLAQYLDKPYEVEDTDLGRITAHHVLTHTTGWPNWPDAGKPIKRLHRPGEQWGYSGAGFVYRLYFDRRRASRCFIVQTPTPPSEETLLARTHRRATRAAQS